MEKINPFNRLVQFVVEEYEVKKDIISLKTTLGNDLKIGGEDGIELLDKFLTHFKIDYDENRERQLHFEEDGFGFINFLSIYNWLKGKKMKGIIMI